jgi:type VI secretion system protein ImpH
LDPEARNETTDLIEELVKSPKEFSYFQALRLLARAFRDRKRSLFDFFREKVRVRADVNLSFPGSDMTGMEKIHPDGDLASDPIFLITVTFMGLYGSASPLPPFYPRDVLEDVLDEKFGLREFFDLISYFSYRNHAYTHFRRSFPSRIIEDGDQFTLDI